MTSLVPLDLPNDVAEHGGGVHGFLEPLLGLGVLAIVLAVLVTAYVLLRNRGLLPPVGMPGFLGGSRTSPEDSAKQILAERFAHGDLSAEEFMERASSLNWIPGIA